jgi:hypothetical protein
MDIGLTGLSDYGLSFLNEFKMRSEVEGSWVSVENEYKNISFLTTPQMAQNVNCGLEFSQDNWSLCA